MNDQEIKNKVVSLLEVKPEDEEVVEKGLNEMPEEQRQELGVILSKEEVNPEQLEQFFAKLIVKMTAKPFNEERDKIQKDLDTKLQKKEDKALEWAKSQK